MADDIDVANDLIARNLSDALSRVRQSAAVIGSKICVECEDKMPAERTKHGFTLCVRCAEDAEREKSLYAES
jgi:RNA polymerase-binding transcription factor DksA